VVHALGYPSIRFTRARSKGAYTHILE